MNRQELFTKVATHLLTQNARSLNASMQCAYRGANGLKCAAGALIPDELYHDRMELRSVRAHEVMPALIQLGVVSAADRGQEGGPVTQGSNLWLLGRLQMLHDSEPVAEWRRLLVEMAHKAGLNMPEGL